MESLMALTAQDIETKLNAGEVIPQIGQVSDEHVRALDKMVKAGQIAKWRGKWFPVAGAGFGIGPDKTCYGTHEAKARVATLVEA